MKLILFDTPSRKNLFPLTATKAIADLRSGILTIKERWAKLLGAEVFVLTDEYLQPLYQTPSAGEYIFIDACAIPTGELVKVLQNLQTNEAIGDEKGLIAGRAFCGRLPAMSLVFSTFKNIQSTAAVKRLSYPFELFQWNDEMIQFDYALITKGRISQNINGVNVIKASQVFIEDGASVSCSSLNASTGPVYIGKNTTVMEGCFIRGPFALCDRAVLKMGAKIYGATTVGPYSSAGGEIKNSIISGYSNKAHDGYLGDSVIGEWCNLGAGTSNSNVKNTAGTVRQWSYGLNGFISTGIKCGVIMGDYSRTAINSSINTGSVIGVSCNVFGEGLLPKLIPDFTWGSKPEGRYQFEKAIRDIGNWKNMKNKRVSEEETEVLKHIFDLSSKQEISS